MRTSAVWLLMLSLLSESGVEARVLQARLELVWGDTFARTGERHGGQDSLHVTLVEHDGGRHVLDPE